MEREVHIAELYPSRPDYVPPENGILFCAECFSKAAAIAQGASHSICSHCNLAECCSKVCFAVTAADTRKTNRSTHPNALAR